MASQERRDDPGHISTRETSIFASRPGLLTAVLVALFLVAAGVRLVNLDAPGVLIDRDFTSAMFARVFYFEHADKIEPWRRTIARATLDNQPTLEPPVTEWLAFVLYRVAGREDLRLARILTSVFWLSGGGFLSARPSAWWRRMLRYLRSRITCCCRTAFFSAAASRRTR